MRPPYRYRSFFWPALLILAGVIALLVNTGAISSDRLYELVNLWPLVLIVLGLEIVVRRSLRGTTGDAIAALIILLAVVLAVAYVAVSPRPAATHTLDAPTNAVGSLEKASVEINAGDAVIKVSEGADLGGDLYHAHIAYSGSKPQAEFDRTEGKVTISQNGAALFGMQRMEVTLQLNPAVPWTISENTGATNGTYQLSHLHVSSLSIRTGAARDDITLGPPSGSVPVTVNAGAATVNVHRPSGTSVSINVAGGAVTLDADNRHYFAVGSVGYATGDLGADVYRIQINGGSCRVTLDSTA